MSDALRLLNSTLMKDVRLFVLPMMIAVFITDISVFGQTATTTRTTATQTNNTTPARITDRPPAPYTKAARDNGIEGIVRLRITLRADGRVTDVAPLTYLPHGLTNQAINSARQLKFEPRRVNGQAMDETTTIEYRFRLYYEEDDSGISKKVVINSRPSPVLTTEELIRLPNRKAIVRVFFGADGQTSVFQFMTNVPTAIRPKFEAAISQIKYTPAVHINGKRTSVVKTVEYTF